MLSKLFKDKYVQAYSDLPAIFNDHRQFEKIVTRFGFKFDEFLALLEPKVKDCNKATTELNRLLKNNPHETILALFCYASHGMIQDGRQVILINEFSKVKGFYRIFGAEENMRTAAQTFASAYIVGIFACCREIFLVNQHSKGISLAEKL